MGFFNQYPYTDVHELNLDFILKQTQALKEQVDILIEKYKNVDQLVEEANKYTNAEIAKVKVDIAKNTSDLIQLSNHLDGEIARIEKRITDEVDEINATHNVRYLRLQQMIAQQWEDMKEYINNQVFDVQVRNFFTGQMVSLQSMFDYLSELHLTDAGTYAQVSNINTYQHYVDKDEVYSNVILSSRTFFNS